MKPFSVSAYTSNWDTVTPNEGDRDNVDTSRLKWTLPLLFGSATAATTAAALSNEIALAIALVAAVAMITRVGYDVYIKTKKVPYSGPKLYRHDICATTKSAEIMDECVSTVVEIHQLTHDSEYMRSLVSDRDLHNAVWQCAVALSEKTSEAQQYAQLVQQRLRESHDNLIEADKHFELESRKNEIDLSETEKYSSDASLSLLYGSISLKEGAEQVSLRRNNGI